MCYFISSARNKSNQSSIKFESNIHQVKYMIERKIHPCQLTDNHPKSDPKLFTRKQSLKKVSRRQNQCLGSSSTALSFLSLQFFSVEFKLLAFQDVPGQNQIAH